jgi:hypothetical protein
MNLYFNQVPMAPMGQISHYDPYGHMNHLPGFLSPSAYNPYLDMQYQNLLLSQMGHLSHNWNPPPYNNVGSYQS